MRITQIPVLLMLSLMIAFTFSSCNSGSEDKGEIAASGFGVTNVLKKIPSNAAVVGVLDMGQLMKKADYDEFVKTPMFQDMLKEIDGENAEYARNILQDPQSAGIATKGKMCMYINMVTEEDISVNFLFPISKLKDFETFVEKAAEKEDSPFKNVQEGEGFKYIEDEKNDSKISLGWDKKMVCMSVSKTQNTTENLKVVFDTKRKESIMTNKKFKAEKSEGHDFMLWVNSTPIMEAMLKNDRFKKEVEGRLFFVDLKAEDLKENVLTWYYNFEKGEMNSGIAYNMNEKIVERFGIVFKEKIKTNFQSYFPIANLINFTVLGLDTKGILKVMNDRNVTGFADMQLAKAGLSSEELLMGLNGDIAIGTYVDPKAEDPSSARQIVIAVAFEKPELVDKLIEASTKMGNPITREGNRLNMGQNAIGEGGGLIDGKVVLLSSSLALLDQIEKGGFKGNEAIAKDHYKRMTAGWMGSHVNYSSLVDAFEGMGPMMGGDMGELVEMLTKYDQMEAFTATVSTEQAEAILSLNDKKRNSLKVLTEIMNQIYEEEGGNGQEPVKEDTDDVSM